MRLIWNANGDALMAVHCLVAMATVHQLLLLLDEPVDLNDPGVGQVYWVVHVAVGHVPIYVPLMVRSAVENQIVWRFHCPAEHVTRLGCNEARLPADCELHAMVRENGSRSIQGILLLLLQNTIQNFYTCLLKYTPRIV